jgi:hypothetical protein
MQFVLRAAVMLVIPSATSCTVQRFSCVDDGTWVTYGHVDAPPEEELDGGYELIRELRH